MLQTLNFNNILASHKGVKGGYALARPLSQISYLELCDMIEGTSYVPSCSESPEKCELYDTCNIVTPLTQLNAKLINFFRDITLEDILMLKDGDAFDIQIVRNTQVPLAATEVHYEHAHTH